MNRNVDSETITLNDFNNICRTCLGSGKLYPIQHTIIGDYRAVELVEVCVLINISAHAMLPQNICEKCLRELYGLKEFMQQCQRNESALLLLIENCELQEANCETEALPKVFDEYKDDTAVEESKVNNVYNIIETKVKYNQNVKEPKVILNECYRCDFIGSNPEELKKHQLDSNHIPGKIRNQKCHKNINSGQSPHICTICGKGFIQLTILNAHLKVHEVKEIPCTNILSGGRKDAYQCEKCGRTFRLQHFFYAHMRKHREKVDDESRNFLCDICSKTFKTKAALNTHKWSCHGEKKYLCNFCGKTSITKAVFQSHLRTHTGEKPYVCTICGKSYSQSASYRLHSFVHQGLRPYECPHCPKRFIRPQHLKYHLRTHSGEKPYSCFYCGKAFAVKGALTVHVRTHTRETPYHCPICDKGFYDSGQRNKHHKSHFKKEEKVELDVIC